MRVTVSTLSDSIFNFYVSPDLELENFKTFCQLETGFPAREILVLHNNRVLVENKKSLRQNGIKDGDVVVIQHIGGDQSQIPREVGSNIEFLPLEPPQPGEFVLCGQYSNLTSLEDVEQIIGPDLASHGQ